MLRCGRLRRVPWAGGLSWAGWLAAILLASGGHRASADSPTAPDAPKKDPANTLKVVGETPKEAHPTVGNPLAPSWSR